jgi:DMSO/TMAO reductase YedYZ molybdopterin-dependent catalytic subunit
MTTTSTTAPASGAAHSRSADLAAFVAGGLAAALAIAIAELMAGLVDGAPSLVIAIGDTVIENQPAGAKELIVELFGSNNKLALNAGIVITTILLAGLVGVAGRRRWTVPLVGFIATGAIGLGAALTRPLVDEVLAVITVVLAISVALIALRLMLAATRPAWAASPDVTDADTPEGATAAPAAAAAAEMPDWDRRHFLQVSGGVAVGSVLLGVVGRNLLAGRSGGAAEGAQLPTAAAPLPEVPAGASLGVEGITPIVVPNDDFYRIDTALVTPRVDAEDWSLRIHGNVDREVTLTYADLQEMPLFEQYVTIACVSNRVGDDLIGNALWTGVDLREVLDMAGVQPGGEQIVGRSVDGFTAGFPTTWAMDPERRPMIAIGMNGQPLPVRHGYPARLIIPGLYGYVSATKWLSEIELTGWDEFDGYWIPRNWAKEAPILTQSRIDTPRSGKSVPAGSTVPIGGVAWAPDRGVQKVEVSIDEGEWQEAQLSVPLNDATWVQWVLYWAAPAAAGEHRFKVRATDGTGEVQTAETSPPAPDGARGHHAITVKVA